VLELGLARQPVVPPGLLRQPGGVGLGVVHAHVQHRIVGPGRAAVVAGTPVHPAAANEVATALVVDDGVAAAGGTRAGTGGGHVAAEFGHGDLGERHGEAAVEAHVVGRFLRVGGLRVAVLGPHAESAVRHHHHLRAAAAV